MESKFPRINRDMRSKPSQKIIVDITDEVNAALELHLRRLSAKHGDMVTRAQLFKEILKNLVKEEYLELHGEDISKDRLYTSPQKIMGRPRKYKSN